MRTASSYGPALRVGLTYDLRDEYLARGFGEEETAELDQRGTIDAIDETLRGLGHQTVRVGHVEQLAERLLAGERWDLVFNICEGLFGMGRESMVPSLLDHFGIPYTFSDPLALTVTLHKGTAKAVLAAAGIPTPSWTVVEDPTRLDESSLRFPVFVKPVAEGTGKGITPDSIVHSAAQLRERVAGLVERYRQPVLIERYLPGRELTVGILGTGAAATAIGTLEIELLSDAEPEVYSFVNKERCEEFCRYLLAPAEDSVVREAEAIAVSAWRTLGCRDAGRVDLRCDEEGRPQLLEINPLAGLHPWHSDLPILCTKVGMPYSELIERIVESARERIGRVERSVCAS